MERCRLTIGIPTPDTDFDPAVILSNPAYVDVWFLDASRELNPAIHGNWGPAPNRGGFYATLSLASYDAVEQITPEFICPSGEFTTVELVCSAMSPDCYLDFWQRRSSRGE